MIHPLRSIAGALALACLFAAPATQAGAPRQDAMDAQIMSSDTFLSAHPDLRFRQVGVAAWKAGDYAKAMASFRRAARFADKPSQAMIAQMLWMGQGVPVDRPLAYAWMDLASERHYKVMLVQRIKYWEAMDAAERAQAVSRGKAIFDEYADRVAQPRLERRLREARSNSAGSRTGFTGAMVVTIPGPSGDITLDGSKFFQDKFWTPKAYWEWQSHDWKELPGGRVNVGPLTGGNTP